MAAATAAPAAAGEFLSEGLITELLGPLKSGREATTYLCRVPRRSGRRFAVLKVYHERTRRNFANAAIYNDGRVILNGQVRRAVKAKTEMGRRFEAALWVDHEYDVLTALFEAGADVPEPLACNESALLMAYVGGPESPAPQLGSAELDPDALPAIRDRILWNVELAMSVNVIHGDLSPFNILVDGAKPVIIDLPQAVDPRFAPAARQLLDRDAANVAAFFARRGCGFDPACFAGDLWWRWRNGQL